MANIKQVAARAGLSVSCVSKYLKNPDSVLPASRERIEAAVRELQYVPSPTARSLRTKRTFTVKVIMESITNPFFADMFEYLRHAFEQAGYTAVLRPIDKPFSPADFEGIDGVAICFADDEQRLHELAAAAGNIPLVGLHWQKPQFGFPCAWTDIRAGMELTAEHLLACGCRRFAYVGGPHGSATSAAKEERARAVLRARGALLPREGICHGAFGFQSGYDAAKQLAGLSPLPDGILCENDVLAAGVLCGLYRQGIAVPEQVRVTGFDNIPLAEMYIPAITSVALPIPAMCRDAARMLILRMEKKEAADAFFPPSLAARQS